VNDNVLHIKKKSSNLTLLYEMSVIPVVPFTASNVEVQGVKAKEDFSYRRHEAKEAYRRCRESPQHLEMPR